MFHGFEEDTGSFRFARRHGLNSTQGVAIGQCENGARSVPKAEKSGVEKWHAPILIFLPAVFLHAVYRRRERNRLSCYNGLIIGPMLRRSKQWPLPSKPYTRMACSSQLSHCRSRSVRKSMS